MELERWPSHGTVGLVVPGEDFALGYWSVENLPQFTIYIQGGDICQLGHFGWL